MAKKSLKLVVNNPLGIDSKRYNVEQDGVNASLLGRWINCREMARLHLLGWVPKRIGAGRIFGTICHGVMDDIYSDIQSGELLTLPDRKRVIKEVRKQEKMWRTANPRADAETLQNLELNCMLAEAIMPIYFQFWHKDLKTIDWIALEHKFKTPIGITHLIGRMDGNFIPVKALKRRWLFETKTKSRLGESGESNIVDILPHELQINLYLGAMVAMYGEIPGGVIMNIVRRPNFKGKKNETITQLNKRIIEDVKMRPEHYFIRMRMSVERSDLRRMQAEHEGLVNEFVKWSHGESAHYRNSDHCENKYGTCEYLRICSRNDYTGLYQRAPRVRDQEK